MLLPPLPPLAPTATAVLAWARRLHQQRLHHKQQHQQAASGSHLRFVAAWRLRPAKQLLVVAALALALVQLLLIAMEAAAVLVPRPVLVLGLVLARVQLRLQQRTARGDDGGCAVVTTHAMARSLAARAAHTTACGMHRATAPAWKMHIVL